MKQSTILPLIFILLLLLGLVFLYLNGTFDEKEPVKENFLSYTMPLIQDSPQKVYYDQLNDAGLRSCGAGNSGCSYVPPGGITFTSAQINTMYAFLIKTVPADHAWVKTASGLELAKKPLPPGKVLDAADLSRLTNDELTHMYKTDICKVFNICDTGITFGLNDPCNKTPVPLSCLQNMFLGAGCTKSGSAYPTNENYTQLSQIPYAEIQMGLGMFQIMKQYSDPLIKSTIATMCTGSVHPILPSSQPSSAHPSNRHASQPQPEDPCKPGESPVAYSCMKKVLHDIYVSQAKK